MRKLRFDNYENNSTTSRWEFNFVYESAASKDDWDPV